MAEIKHNLLCVIRAGIANGNPVPAPGYKSLMQKRLEAREAQIKVQEDMLERLKKIEKKAWLAGLSKESREAIARQGSGPEEEFNLNFISTRLYGLKSKRNSFKNNHPPRY